MMTIAFLIKRKNYYRHFGPVIDAALRRNYRVECWHDLGQAKTGWKGSEYPDHLPLFQHGTPDVVDASDLWPTIDTRKPDAIVTLDPPQLSGKYRVRWFWQQASTDVLLAPAEWYHLQETTAIGVFSPWWKAKFIEMRHAEEYAHKIHVVGSPEMDIIPDITPFPAPKRSVVLFPIPVKSSGMEIPAKTVRKMHRAIGEWAQRYGYLLIVKHREKDRKAWTGLEGFPVVDIGDEMYYPPTALQLIKGSSLTIHCYSGAVLESVACGVPSLNIGVHPEDVGLVTSMMRPRHHTGMFSWPGAVTSISIEDAIAGLPRPEQLEARKPAMDQYIRRFLLQQDQQASDRWLDVIAATVAGSP